MRDIHNKTLLFKVGNVRRVTKAGGWGRDE